jgi:hypothetical protein
MTIKNDYRAHYAEWVASLGFTHHVSLNMNMALTPNNSVVRVSRRTAQPFDGATREAPPSRRVPTTWTPRPCHLRALLKNLDAEVHERLVGPRVDRISAKKRLIWIAMIESPEWNLHCHMLWRVPIELHDGFNLLWGNYRQADLWRDLLRSGDSHVRQVDDGDRAAAYDMKQKPYEADDRFILSTVFWPERLRPIL